MIYCFSLLLVLGLLSALPGGPGPSERVLTDPIPSKTLQLEVSNIGEQAGMIWVGIYTSEDNFLVKEKARLVGVKVTTTGELLIDLTDMKVGQEYALAIFHDIDNDGEMNRNWLGLPAEPWAFSGEAITRLRLPRFSEVKFTMTAEMMRTSLRLRMI